ncbi:hypothetical protein PIB30_075982 [Stylosanthes scabra]|uniref:Uncharacterized protein n=1 Tax=Stylosanthes scabra TaxID=79078 RepID=A0ABU6TPT0_9FABA|nr:hypothetical protein [Stylosanthes scabra]
MRSPRDDVMQIVERVLKGFRRGFEKGKHVLGELREHKGLRVLNLAVLQNAVQLQGIDSICNRVDSLSLFLRKMGFREQRIDSHDLRIDSSCHRGQLIIDAANLFTIRNNPASASDQVVIH